MSEVIFISRFGAPPMRVPVVRRGRKFARSAARTLMSIGWPRCAICRALKVSPAQLARLGGPAGLWGAAAGEMRRLMEAA